jgi:hypothetical protein
MKTLPPHSSTPDHVGQADPKSPAEILKEHVLGHVDDGVTTTVAVAKAMKISKSYASKLIAQLVAEKRLKPAIGRGYALTKSEKLESSPALSASTKDSQTPPEIVNTAKPQFHESFELAKSEQNHASSGQQPPQTNERHKAKKDQEPVSFECADWRDFLDLSELSRKAGCKPEDRQRVVAKEAADNGCDAGTEVTITPWKDPQNNLGLCVTNNGSAIDPQSVAEIYSPNRNRYSTKRIRRVLRGILGNGARVIGGAVGASGGMMIAETRDHRLTLSLDRKTGKMLVAADETIPEKPGFRLYFSLGPTLPFRETDFDLATETIRLRSHGQGYDGPSSPWWYGPGDFFRLAQEVTSQISFLSLCRKCGFRIPPPLLPGGSTQPKNSPWSKSLKHLKGCVPAIKKSHPKNLGFSDVALFFGCRAMPSIAALPKLTVPDFLTYWKPGPSALSPIPRDKGA